MGIFLSHIYNCRSVLAKSTNLHLKISCSQPPAKYIIREANLNLGSVSDLITYFQVAETKLGGFLHY